MISRPRLLELDLAGLGQRDPFEVDEEAALAELERTWEPGGYHAFGAGGGLWYAVSSAGEVLTGDTGRLGSDHPRPLAGAARMTSREHDVSGLTAAELERARRDLQVSLSLA